MSEEPSLKEIVQLLTDPNIKEQGQDFSKAKSYRQEKTFNVFTLASDLYYRENFHSDIIREFLDPCGSHGEGFIFLELFFKILRKLNPNLAISVDLYSDASVSREYQNIDILISSEGSKHCIIIENKMNNAVDMYKQIPRYYNTMADKGYSIDAVVYIPLCHYQTPDQKDWTQSDKETINRLLVILPAYTNGMIPDLVKEWIEPCSMRTKNIDCISALRQYSDLIKSLVSNNMNTKILEEFYKSIISTNSFTAARNIKEMMEAIPAYMAERLLMHYSSQTDKSIYTKIWKWKPDIFVLDFKVGGINYAIDVLTSLDGYNVSVFCRNANIEEMITEDKKPDSLSQFNFVDERYRSADFSFSQEEELIKWINNFRSEISAWK